jgi:hypothetical protein
MELRRPDIATDPDYIRNSAMMDAEQELIDAGIITQAARLRMWQEFDAVDASDTSNQDAQNAACGEHTEAEVDLYVAAYEFIDAHDTWWSQCDSVDHGKFKTLRQYIESGQPQRNAELGHTR